MNPLSQSAVQYVFETNVDGSWTIFENTPEGPLNYDLQLGSYDEAFQLVRYIQWLESTYSPAR